MHVEIEKPKGVIFLVAKILPLPGPAGSLFSPKYQLWNFAAHKAALLPREGNLSDGQVTSQCCWPCQGRQTHRSPGCSSSRQ